MPFLSGILHGPVPPCRTENHQSESYHSGHAETASRFPYQFRGDTSTHPDRQGHGHPRKRENRKAYYEKRSGWTQFVCAGRFLSSILAVFILNIIKNAVV